MRDLIFVILVVVWFILLALHLTSFYSAYKKGNTNDMILHAVWLIVGIILIT